MDYLKIILSVVVAMLVCWVYFGDRLKHYFRNYQFNNLRSEEVKDRYSDYLDSVERYSIKHIYQFTDPGKTKKLNRSISNENKRYLYVKGECIGFTEGVGSTEILKFYRYNDYKWNKDSRSKEFMQSLISEFKKSYSMLEYLCTKIGNRLSIPLSDFQAFEDKFNIKLPEEFIFVFTLVGVSASRLSGIFKPENMAKFRVNLRFSDAFIHHLNDQFDSFNNFSEDEKAFLSKEGNDFENLVYNYYYDVSFGSAKEYEQLPMNFMRFCLDIYEKIDDEPVKQVVFIDAVGEADEYLILDTSLAGYFWTDLLYDRSNINGVFENPVFKHFQYSDYLDTLKSEIMEKTYLIQLLLK